MVNLNARAVQVVAELTPWVAPAPTAWLVFERTQRHLGWPLWVAIVAGVTLEALGIAILATAFDAYTYNRERRQKDPAAPMWPSYLLIGCYFLAAELLTVALDVAPSWFAPLAPAVFPVLSLAAMAVLALRADHKRRLSDVERTKAEERAGRERRKQERKHEEAAREREQAAREQVAEPAIPFKCLICGDEFATQAALNGHGNAHRSDNGRESALESVVEAAKI